MSFGVEAIDSVLPHGGLPCGALHEWCYSALSQEEYGPLGLLAFLADRALVTGRASVAAHKETSEKLILWVGKKSWPTPYVLSLLSSRIVEHSLFIDAHDSKQILWALELALRSPCVAAVITSLAINFATSRRLALAAREGGGVGLLIRNARALDRGSAASTRWSVQHARSENDLPRFEIELMKYRGAQPSCSRWTIELGAARPSLHDARREEDNGREIFSPAKLSLHLLPGMVDRAVPQEQLRQWG